LFAAAMLYWKIRTLTAVVFATSRIPGSIAAAISTTVDVPRVLVYRPSSIAPPVQLVNSTIIDVSVIEFLRTYLPLELAIWVIVGLTCVIATIIMARRLWPKCNQNATNICLEIGNTSEYLIINWLKLPHLPSCYDFSVTELSAVVSVRSIRWIVGELQLKIDNMTIHHNVLDAPIKLPNSQFIGFWTMRRVKHLLDRPHYLMIAVTGANFERHDSIMIKSINPVKIEPLSSYCNPAFSHCKDDGVGLAMMSQTAVPSSLYPSLSEIEVHNKE